MKVLITGGSGFIGTNLIERFSSEHELLNLDIKPPQITKHNAFWKECDVLDADRLQLLLNQFKPEWVIHLAARTDLDGNKSIDEYAVNFVGTQNLCLALRQIASVQRVLFFSSMYVCQPGYRPSNSEDFCPHTIYGKSKQLMEEFIRNYKHQYDWTIIRPTSIWGPFFSEPYANFFNMVIKGRYFHLGKKACKKTYGYIGNLGYQVEQLLKYPYSLSGSMFYLGDYEPYHISEWADEIASALGKTIKTLPFSFFRIAGICGDLLKAVGIKFPMTSFRLTNMTTDNIMDTGPLSCIAPELPFSRKDGIVETINWIKNTKC